MGKFAWEKWAAMLICIAFFVLAVTLGFRYLLPIVLPFLLAGGLSLVIRPASRSVSARTGIPKKLCSVVLLLLFIGALVALVSITARRLLTELEELLDAVLNRTADPSFQSNDFFSVLAEKLPFLQRLGAYRAQINQFLSDSLSNLAVTLSSSLPELIATLFSALPNILFFILVATVAALYFCTSDADLLCSLLAYLPAPLRTKLPAWKKTVKRFSGRFLKAYLLLLALTFALLLAGFLLLRQKYAFLLALLVALVDLLPVLGVGTVLIPWACIALWNRHYYLGFGLLVLYVVVLVVRQIAEPKLLGKTLGLHPLPSLFATFAGWYLFGFWGMLFAPIVLVFVKSLLEGVFKTEVHNL